MRPDQRPPRRHVPPPPLAPGRRAAPPHPAAPRASSRSSATGNPPAGAAASRSSAAARFAADPLAEPRHLPLDRREPAPIPDTSRGSACSAPAAPARTPPPPRHAPESGSSATRSRNRRRSPAPSIHSRSIAGVSHRTRTTAAQPGLRRRLAVDLDRPARPFRPGDDLVPRHRRPPPSSRSASGAARHLLARRPAQPAPRRQQRHRLDQVGLARPVRRR